LFLYRTVKADGGYCTTFEADDNVDAKIQARLQAAFPHVDKAVFLELGAVQEGDGHLDLNSFWASIKPKPDEGHEDGGACHPSHTPRQLVSIKQSHGVPFYLKTDASSNTHQFDIVGKLKPAGGVEGEEGEEEAGYHGLENMNLDEPFDAEASGNEDSEDGCGSIGKYEDVGDGLEHMDLHEDFLAEGPGLPNGALEPPGPFDSLDPPPAPVATARRRSARAATTAQAASAQDNGQEGGQKGPKPSSNVQYPIVGMLTDEARRFASFTGASDDMLPVIIIWLLCQAARRMFKTVLGIEAPSTLNIDDPATRANILYMFGSAAHSYNIHNFNPEALIKKFDSTEAGPKNLLRSRNLLDLNVNMGTGTCSLYQRGR
jgi:hypothetical protein